MNDLSVLFLAEEKSRRWMAERENASARYQLAKIAERCAYLLSQHEPVASMDLDREKLRIVFSYLNHGDLHRLSREVQKEGEI